MTEESPTKTRGLEVRSIDYVPKNERHGKVWHIGPLWFMCNAQIATLAIGVVSFAAGGNLVWSLIAITIGLVIGTVFMAAHSSQGPKLGLPQMIQSRPQFGYVGALLVWLFAFLQYAGFNVFNTVLAGNAISGALHSDPVVSPFWFWAVTLVGAAVALFGYDLIHKMERYLTYVTVVVLALLTFSALVNLHLPDGAFNLGDFNPVAFFSQLGVVAGYQISWAIYVSDYSRYLPAETPNRSTFRWTFWGSAIGGAWLIFLGAYLAAAVADFDAGDPITAIQGVADSLFPGFGTIALLVIAFGLIAVIVLNMYGGLSPSSPRSTASARYDRPSPCGSSPSRSPQASPASCLSTHRATSRSSSLTSSCSSCISSSRGRRSTSPTTSSCARATMRSRRSSSPTVSTVVGAGRASLPTSSRLRA
ncbi:cytosine permease [Cryobacterium breve]|uniref:Cytosine permease n=1 Tax=Cryobacterium breve TaxID=1259258 RepID=A0ABY7NEV1_9MICO|nr:cytosine permease [Cryobacterium breve]